MEVEFAPERIVVKINLTGKKEPKQITRIRLSRMIQPRDFEDNYRIEWHDETETGAHFLQDIDVMMPKGKAGRLNSEDVHAYVIIDDGDLEQVDSEGWTTKDVCIILPPGFEDVEVVRKPNPIKLRVVRRTKEKGAAKAAE